jgi:hypothetical protein
MSKAVLDKALTLMPSLWQELRRLYGNDKRNPISSEA